MVDEARETVSAFPVRSSRTDNWKTAARSSRRSRSRSPDTTAAIGVRPSLVTTL